MVYIFSLFVVASVDKLSMEEVSDNLFIGVGDSRQLSERDGDNRQLSEDVGDSQKLFEGDGDSRQISGSVEDSSQISESDGDSSQLSESGGSGISNSQEVLSRTSSTSSSTDLDPVPLRSLLLDENNNEVVDQAEYGSQSMSPLPSLEPNGELNRQLQLISVFPFLLLPVISTKFTQRTSNAKD